MTLPPSLTADAVVNLGAPVDVMARLREHFAGHGTIRGNGADWTIAFDIGTASARLLDDGIAFTVAAQDESSLSLMQWSVAEHVDEFTPGETPRITWNGGTPPGAQLPYFREMRILRVADVTPGMRRLTLAGNDLGRFARNGLHVRLLFPPRPGAVPAWPVMGADGRQAWPDGERPLARVYTIRRIDVAAGEIDIDFVLHEGGAMPGARFAKEARPGAVVGMTGPGGGLPDAQHCVLAGDETALPAIARMLEELPAGRRATAFVEIAGPQEKQALAEGPGIAVNWLSRDGAPAGTTDLLVDALAALEAESWSGDTCLWAGCEHRAAKAIRAFARADGLISRQRQLIAAYWRRDHAGDTDG